VLTQCGEGQGRARSALHPAALRRAAPAAVGSVVAELALPKRPCVRGPSVVGDCASLPSGGRVQRVVAASPPVCTMSDKEPSEGFLDVIDPFGYVNPSQLLITIVVIVVLCCCLRPSKRDRDFSSKGCCGSCDCNLLCCTLQCGEGKDKVQSISPRSRTSSSPRASPRGSPVFSTHGSPRAVPPGSSRGVPPGSFRGSVRGPPPKSFRGLPGSVGSLRAPPPSSVRGPPLGSFRGGASPRSPRGDASPRPVPPGLARGPPPGSFRGEPRLSFSRGLPRISQQRGDTSSAPETIDYKGMVARLKLTGVAGVGEKAPPDVLIPGADPSPGADLSRSADPSPGGDLSPGGASSPGSALDVVVLDR
jgi:hypothetical protein